MTDENQFCGPAKTEREQVLEKAYHLLSQHNSNLLLLLSEKDRALRKKGCLWCRVKTAVRDLRSKEE